MCAEPLLSHISTETQDYELSPKQGAQGKVPGVLHFTIMNISGPPLCNLHFSGRQKAVKSITMLLQVRAVPVRKDDEVSVVRGTYKVSSFKGCISAVGITLSAISAMGTAACSAVDCALPAKT